MHMQPELITAPIHAQALDAVAFGLLDGGVEVVTGYPGFHAHDLVELCGGTFSVNERTAYAVAWGAALAGRRAVVAVKNVGLSDAADPFLNSINLRTNAGLVVVVFDDVEVAGSQTRQDSRHFFDLCPGLWLEPVSAAHAYQCARAAAQLSEQFGVPIVLRITNALLATADDIVRRLVPRGATAFRRDPARAVAHPVNVRLQTEASAERELAIARFAERQFRASGTGADRVVVHVGASQSSPPEETKAARCTVWTYPLPVRGLQRFLRRASTIEVIEFGTSFAKEKIQALNGRLDIAGRDPSAAADHSANHRISLLSRR